MNKKLMLAGIVGLFSFNSLYSQDFMPKPTPQIYQTLQDSIAIPSVYRLETGKSLNGTPSQTLLRRILTGENTDNSDFKILVGVKGDKAVKKYDRHIPDSPEGYYLKIDKNRIVIAAADERGAYYGLQTLSQLLSIGKLPLTEITDYPDVPYRGVVEGFYGKPWSHESRLRQLEFYGRNKMNVYLYGPKDDPYHRTPNWRKPYPEKEARQLKELVEKAKENNVIFYWAIHPGQDIKWNDEDRDLLIRKFESMYELGVRGFAVFFDDISGNGVNAEKQAELLNYIDDHFVKQKEGVAPLVMCPTEYNKAWSNPEKGYLPTLGEKLHKDIHVMWTGDKVAADIGKQTLDFVNPLLKRKAYIWWNYPVSDYVQDHLLLGPVYGNGLDIKDDVSAFISNPMEYAEASKISLYSIADYAWNMEAYDSQQSWECSIRDLMPQNAEYLKTFASHNSDLGPNGHNFRRDESTDLQPALASLTDTFVSKNTVDSSAYRQVAQECGNITVAADMLLASDENPAFIKEATPWIIYFKQLGEYGEEVLRMMSLLQAQDSDGFLTAYRHARALQMLMYQTNTTYNQDHQQPGVKGGSRYLLPAFDKLFETSVIRYNRLHGTDMDTQASYMPYSLESNIAQISGLTMLQQGKSGRISPAHEVIRWQADGYLTVSMNHARKLKDLTINCGIPDIGQIFSLEYTSDGETWHPLPLKSKGISFFIKLPEETPILQLRFKNSSNTQQQTYFKQFRFTER